VSGQDGRRLGIHQSLNAAIVALKLLLLLLLFGPFIHRSDGYHWRIKRFVVYVYDVGSLEYICTASAILTEHDIFRYKYMLSVDL